MMPVSGIFRLPNATPSIVAARRDAYQCRATAGLQQTGSAWDSNAAPGSRVNNCAGWIDIESMDAAASDFLMLNRHQHAVNFVLSDMQVSFYTENQENLREDQMNAVAQILSAKDIDMISLPIIDIAGLRSSNIRKRMAVARQIRSACTDKGFFYISNHGVPRDLIARAFAATEAFFALPDVEKRRIDKALSKCNRGYEPLRGQTLELDAPPDLKEGLYIGNEMREDDPRVIAGKFNHGPNQWPQNIPGFRQVMEDYFISMSRLSQLLMTGIAQSLGLPADYFKPVCTDAMETLRLLHYPPQPATAVPNEKGCGAHTDFGTLTVLAQDDNGGLQVFDPRNGWIHAPPIPDTLVVNLGDLTARWTNDYYRSTLHRVVNISGRERYSIPFFYTGNIDHIVKCLPTCCSPGNPPKYPPISIEQHFIDCYNRTYR